MPTAPTVVPDAHRPVRAMPPADPVSNCLRCPRQLLIPSEAGPNQPRDSPAAAHTLSLHMQGNTAKCCHICRSPCTQPQACNPNTVGASHAKGDVVKKQSQSQAPVREWVYPHATGCSGKSSRPLLLHRPGHPDHPTPCCAVSTNSAIKSVPSLTHCV